MMKRWLLFVAGTMSTLFTLPAFAAANEVLIAGIPIEFIFFALTLLCVALFHNYTFYVAITGLAVITTYKTVVTGFTIVCSRKVRGWAP